MKTWQLYHQISLRKINSDIYQNYYQYAKTAKLIQKLYSEHDEKKRKELYSKACLHDDTIYNHAQKFFESIVDLAKQDNFSSVHDWIIAEDKHLIDWKSLFENKEYNKIISDYSKNYSSQRKNDLNKSQYPIWDHWYVGPNNNTLCFNSTQLVPSFKKSLKLAQEFYISLGFENIISKIKFIKKDKSPTCASINYYNGKWTNEVHLSEIGAGSTVGSLAYLIAIVHEIAHNLQARLIDQPDKHYFLPPFSLIEVVSMFFEQIFMRSEFLKSKIDPFLSIDKSVKHIQEKNKEQLARVLSCLEFELKIYQLVESKKLTPEHMAYINSSVLRKYCI